MVHERREMRMRKRTRSAIVKTDRKNFHGKHVAMKQAEREKKRV